ncbi:MAG: hypothetical protein JXA06_00200 [Bacteroidetes bacterium]|nr:hypothetical protein [Bacteroidota bacterium]
MAEIAEQIFTLEKKVGADAKSPMFAQLASLYLEQNRAEDALRVCDAGLANFPFYTTGHLVKGKALAALHMTAEARREFEFVLEFLPRNEMVSALLEQVQPGEEETIAARPFEVQTKIISPPKYEEPPLEENKIIPPPQVYPEQEFSFTRFELPEQQKIELPPAPAPASETSFFEAITQTPTEKTTEDIFGFNAPPAETPEVMEPPAISEFGVPTEEPPVQTETQATAFEEIPRSVPEPSGEYEIPFAAAGEEGIAQAASEEESFISYAARRRAELKDENTILLEDYLNNTAVTPPDEVAVEFPAAVAEEQKPEETVIPETLLTDSDVITPRISLEIPETIIQPPPKEESLIYNTIDLPQISAEIQDKVEEPAAAEEQSIDLSMLLPQVSAETEEKTVDLNLSEERPSDTTITLPEIPPAELPLSDSIQNNIEEIANRLKGAGKITPVIDIAQKETPPASEQDLPVSMGFVTPTLAEIYAKQGWFDDAIKAYKALARNKPGERERFEKRIEELEKLKTQGKK